MTAGLRGGSGRACRSAVGRLRWQAWARMPRLLAPPGDLHPARPFLLPQPGRLAEAERRLRAVDEYAHAADSSAAVADLAKRLGGVEDSVAHLAKVGGSVARVDEYGVGQQAGCGLLFTLSSSPARPSADPFFLRSRTAA